MTPRAKANGQARGTPQTSLAKVEAEPPEAKRIGKGGGKGKRGKSEPRPEKRNRSAFRSGYMPKGRSMQTRTPSR